MPCRKARGERYSDWQPVFLKVCDTVEFLVCRAFESTTGIGLQYHLESNGKDWFVI